MNLHELLDLYIGIVIANVVLGFILAFLEYRQSTYYKPFIVHMGEAILCMALILSGPIGTIVIGWYAVDSGLLGDFLAVQLFETHYHRKPKIENKLEEESNSQK